MANAVKVLIGLSILAFLLAVFAAVLWPIFGISPEGFSRAANNLALIAIALLLYAPRGSRNS